MCTRAQMSKSIVSGVQSSVVRCQLAGTRPPTRRKKKATNPYRPSVGAFPSNDIPLIVKGSEKFPASSGGSKLGSQVSPGGLAQRNKKTKTHINMPFTTCQNLTNASVKKTDKH